MIIFVWRTISDTVFSFLTYFSSGVNNRPVPIYQSSPLYLFFFEDKMFFLSCDTFRVKNAVKRYWKITHDQPGPTIIWPAPPATIHSHWRTNQNFATTNHACPRPAIISPAPPTTSHSFPVTSHGFKHYWKINSINSKLFWYGFRHTFFFISNSIFEVNVRVA